MGMKTSVLLGLLLALLGGVVVCDCARPTGLYVKLNVWGLQARGTQENFFGELSAEMPRRVR